MKRASLSPLWLVPLGFAIGTALGVTFGRGPFFLGLAAAALTGAIWVLWKSIQNLTGEAELTLEEALSLGAPNAEEERKVAVLRALKDLEYERTVGKIDDQDFLELSAKYRAEARVLLQLVDDKLEPARAAVFEELDRRIASELGTAKQRTSEDEVDAKSEPEEAAGTEESVRMSGDRLKPAKTQAAPRDQDTTDG
ncbi:MAG TPA: hypothetical protein VHM70_02240 [Polyangiaceae bacterium]|nr:hypothetical protein [Polyangiaceae bacterium]